MITAKRWTLFDPWRPSSSQASYLLPVPTDTRSAVLCHACTRELELIPVPENAIHEHHKTLVDLERSKDKGCYICCILWQRLVNDSSHYLQDLDKDASISRAVHRLREPPMPSYEHTLKFELGRQLQRQTSAVGHIFKLMPWQGLLPELSTDWDEEAIANLLAAQPAFATRQNHISSFPLSNSTGSQSTLDLVSTWFRQCFETHKGCGIVREALNNGRGPKRLVNVGSLGSNYWRLEVFEHGAPASLRFAALSHCWGPPDVSGNLLKLTTENIKDFEAGMPESALSKSFQDCFSVVRYLGLQYVWIDSLCIVQNSPEDWNREAPQMQLVYLFADCTICATKATSGRDGCFSTRDPESILPRKIELHPAPDENSKLYLLLDGHYAQDQISNAPLNRRAWVTQERYLSRRTIHFAADQVFWECECRNACETFPASLPNCLHDPTGYLFQGNHARMAMVKTNPEYGSSDRYRGFMYGEWRMLVQNYMSRGLTNKKDKLVAIESMARYFQEALKDQYSAGLWMKDIPFGLLWRVDQSKLPNLSTETFGAPSWSWASVVDAPIYRYAVKGHGYMIDQPDALCIQVHGVQSDQDVGLMLVLKGCLHVIPFPTEQEVNGALRCSLEGEVLWLFLDRPTQFVDGMLFLFPVMYTMSCADLTEGNSHCIRGLALRTSGNSVMNEFVRVGLWYGIGSAICRNVAHIVVDDENRPGKYEGSSHEQWIWII
ncbi:HET-domain-containing protein [Zopfia rhizophila CBS 207.26]|uniref:HET-domain-containing protein n=1 Tax=Zopfia rhizophila CBS 207.26 TaxID=1314779 RepID=A0A6A6DWN5_9PEZI|nr:HET-domain-containing protein [Zopfia rhizophila CBS 207.26]